MLTISVLKTIATAESFEALCINARELSEMRSIIQPPRSKIEGAFEHPIATDKEPMLALPPNQTPVNLKTRASRNTEAMPYRGPKRIIPSKIEEKENDTPKE
jgi:hypothetical protein